MQNKYLIALLAALVLYMLSRTEKGQQVVDAAASAVGSAVRGIRNNNPGNVRESSLDRTQWVGERASDDDPAFEEFTEMRYGVRASAIVFRNYQRLYGLRSVAAMIARWAPPNENDTPAYIAFVCKRIGVNESTPINLLDDEMCYAFLRAVFRKECGLPAEAIPEATVREGIALA